MARAGRLPHVECVVVGAGVIGLVVARALALAGREVVVVEAADAIGTETSSRSSEVIHAGIYYPTGSLKARLCVEGKQALYQYCRDKDIAHRRTGKLIVAVTKGELSTLEQYRAQAAANGVGDLSWLSARQVGELEPEIRASGALFSPSTGIIDSHEYMRALQADLEAAGGQVVLRTEVRRIQRDRGLFHVSTNASDDPVVSCRCLVNAAGLRAQELSHGISDLPATSIPPAFFARGQYYALSGPAPFRHLVYPRASRGGIGIHVTLDMAGAVRFGPDVSWIDKLSYVFDESNRDAFVQAIRRYYPALEESRLQPAYVGVRPKLVGPGDTAGDFVIQGPGEHGVPGLVALYGIESPGLTASLAIAAEVASMVE